MSQALLQRPAIDMRRYVHSTYRDEREILCASIRHFFATDYLSIEELVALDIEAHFPVWGEELTAALVNQGPDLAAYMAKFEAAQTEALAFCLENEVDPNELRRELQHDKRA